MGKLSNSHRAELLAINPSEKKSKRAAKIKSLAKKHGIDYTKMYARWHYTVNNIDKQVVANSSPLDVATQNNMVGVHVPLPVKAGKGKNIIPYVLEYGAENPNRMDNNALSTLKQRLVPIFESMQIRQTVPVPKPQRTSIRKMLNEVEKTSGFVFTIAPIKDNKNMLRVHRVK